MTPYSIRGATASALVASVEQGILSGSLPPETALPPVRVLARELRRSPATVAAAYRTLRARGLVTARGRLGTRVSSRPALSRPALPEVAPHLANLAEGNPDPSLLPDPGRHLAAAARTRRLYGRPSQSPHLVSVARAAFRADGVPAASMAVMGGALDAIERVLQAHLRPGDPVAMEDPGFTSILDLLAALGLPVLPMGLDEKGVRPAELRAALRKGARAVILTPRAQNPTGTAWDEPRTRELARVLDAHPDVLVVEDDHGGPVSGTPARTTCAGGRERWAVVRSVSKSLGPDLRLAVLAGDPMTVGRVEGRQAVGAGWVSHLLQEAVAGLWQDPAVARGLRDAAAAYAKRRGFLIEALAARGIHAHGASGLNVWVPVDEEAATMAHLAAHGYAVRAGERYRIRSGPGVRVTVSTMKRREAARLAACWAAFRQAPAQPRQA